MSVVAPLAIGLAFGWLLERAGLTRYDRIVGVYRFTDLTVLKFLGSALAVGGCALQGALWLGLATAVPVSVTAVVTNLVGGALFGIGMAGVGFCPGTIAAGAGTGQLDYLLPGMAGLLSGALAFGWTYSHFAPRLVAVARVGSVTLPGALGASGGLLSFILLELALIGFYALERGVRPPALQSRTVEVPPGAVHLPNR